MEQEESMKEENEVSEQWINNLFKSKYFTHKFYELQIHNSQELQKHHNSSDQEGIEKCSIQVISEDEVINEISDVLLFNLKESILIETNTILESKLSIINITEEIESIKQCLSKINQNSFNTKASTQESISPEKDEKYKDKKGKNNAIFFNGEEEESFISGNGKKLSDDKPSNFSFMSSFLNEDKFVQDEEILNEKINASISKVESSIEDRISQVEKVFDIISEEFTRRIEQVMKTIKNLISMINENEATPKLNPHHHPLPQLHQQSNHTKSEINPSESTPNMKVISNEPSIEMDTLVAKTAKISKEEKNLLNMSTSKLSSFFKVRKN